MVPGQDAEWLDQLGRDTAWFEALVQCEAAYRWHCEQLCTPENRARTLAVLRLALTCFDIELMDLESAAAVREACLCLSADGLSLEELAGQEHQRVERQRVLLESLPEEWQQRFLSAEPGQVLQLITGDERFQICRVLDKHEPALADAAVVARVDAELVAAHFGTLVSEHIAWLLERGPAA